MEVAEQVETGDFTIDYFLLCGSKNSEKEAHTTKRMPMERIMSPIPTNGETMPPKRKMMAPTKAEAAPALLCSSFIAMATVLVKHSPLHANRTTISSSYQGS